MIPYARNPRKNDPAVERMKASIQEFGFKIPILARSTGEIVDGHLRLKAALALGIEAVPVIPCDEWSEAQVKAFRLMVNRSATWADWDLTLVALELEELKAVDYDLQFTGFDPLEMDGLLFGNSEPEPEEVIVESPGRPVTRLGDLWPRRSSSAVRRCCFATRCSVTVRLSPTHAYDHRSPVWSRL